MTQPMQSGGWGAYLLGVLEYAMFLVLALLLSDGDTDRLQATLLMMILYRQVMGSRL